MIAGSVRRKLQGIAYRRRLRRGTPIVVYQMGKVGSGSVVHSLKQCGVTPVFHVHRMNPDNIEEVRQEHVVINRPPPDDRHGQWLHADIIRNRRKAKFITLVREPISRNVSAFFENFGRFTGIEYDDADFSTEQLVNMFIMEYRHTVPMTWFDVEIRQVLGIDVYAYSFPKEKGYLQIEQGPYELLILKLEVDDSIKEKAIGEFLGMGDFRLIRSNVADAKSYSQTYRSFLQAIELPAPYVETMCNAEYTKHFYSESEIDAIRSKWQNKSGRTELPATVHEQLAKAASRIVD